jgi:outer membrane receptor protein involved in Fe transport
MRIKFLFITLFVCAIAFAQNKGTITGVLTDKEANNVTLPFANAAIKGTSIGTTTDEKGKYTLTVAAGNHTIVFSFLGYENVEVPVTVKAGETITIDRALGSGSYKLEDVVVKASGSREKETALLLDQKKAVEIKQSIGAQEMARKGVSNVQEGLTKITGVSKVESRGLFVRGLEERYNNLLINDLQAPSSSPFKKIVPLDLFPTDVVGVLNVYKTFNPNIPGDFAGATINIETTQPRTSITKISTGFGYVTNNNGDDFLMSKDANTTQGFFGLLGKDRALPSAFGASPTSRILTAAQYNETGGQNTWDVENTGSPINNSIGFLHTEKFNLKDEKSITYIFSINGDNKYQIQKGVDRTFLLNQGDYDNNLFTSRYSYTTSFSGLAGAKYKSKRFEIALNSFVLRSTASVIQDQLGDINNSSALENLFIRENKFEESKYWNNQILANYNLSENGNSSVKGGFSFAKTTFGQPDRKFLRGEKISDTQTNITFGGNNLIRQFLDISGDRFFSGMFEYNLKFNAKENGKSNKLSFGYNMLSNEEVSSYRFVFGRPLLPLGLFTIDINSPNELINTNVNAGLINFTEESTGDYKTKLFNNNNAAYANIFLNIGSRLEINGGIRAEQTLREIKYRFTTDATNSKYRKIEKNKTELLPSLNVKYGLNEKSNIRFAASKTLTRPVSIEIMPIQYINPDGTVEIGNPNIDNSSNYNFDLKYELFPSSNQLFVLGVFGKQIINPIERIFIPTASSGGQITTYQNSKEAVLYGAELEVLLDLKRISPYLKNFSWGFNTSVMKTKVNVDLIKNPLENNSSRALQGASDWLINSDLKYDFKFNEEMKNSISLVYGVAGDRIFSVGTAGLDHIYEKPFSKLDFIWSSALSKNINVKFAVDNILNPSFRRVLGNNSEQVINEADLTVRDFKRGTGFSLGVNYTF